MDNQFNYKYVAPTEEERREIASIRSQYEPTYKSESKLDRLRRLDSLVKNSAVVLGLCLGIGGSLVFGLGLTMILVWNILLWGILVIVVGVVPMAFAYPSYKRLLKKNKKKYGAEILQLSEELLNEEKIKKITNESDY